MLVTLQPCSFVNKITEELLQLTCETFTIDGIWLSGNVFQFARWQHLQWVTGFAIKQLVTLQAEIEDSRLEMLAAFRQELLPDSTASARRVVFLQLADKYYFTSA